MHRQMCSASNCMRSTAFSLRLNDARAMLKPSRQVDRYETTDKEKEKRQNKKAKLVCTHKSMSLFWLTEAKNVETKINCVFQWSKWYTRVNEIDREMNKKSKKFQSSFYLWFGSLIFHRNDKVRQNDREQMKERDKDKSYRCENC